MKPAVPYEIIRPATQAEWLEVRKHGIGSSEAGAVMGLNPWQSAYQLWRHKLGIDPPVQENFAMRAGHYLEGVVAHFYADATGATIIKSSAGDWIARDRKQPWLQVSPDRLAWPAGVSHSPANRMIVECKTTQRTIDPDHVPMSWFVQLQYQLMVMRLNRGALAWLTAGRDFGYLNVERDPALCEMIETALAAFWWDNIVGRKEPACITGDDAELHWPRQADGKTAEADGNLLDVVANLRTIKARIAELTTAKADLEGRLKAAMADAELLVDDFGNTLATWRTPKRDPAPKFDAKRFQAEHPDECAPYMVSQPPTRRLLIK